MLSLLARLHNILDDNSNREFNIDHMSFWPTSVTKYVSIPDYLIEMNLDDFIIELLNLFIFQPNELQYRRCIRNIEHHIETSTPISSATSAMASN